MLGFFKDIEFVGEDTSRDFVFEEKYVDILISVISIDRVLILDFVQDTLDQDNAGEILI